MAYFLSVGGAAKYPTLLFAGRALAGQGLDRRAGSVTMRHNVARHLIIAVFILAVSWLFS